MINEDGISNEKTSVENINEDIINIQNEKMDEKSSEELENNIE
jgi:hypothetical protein